VHHICDCVCVLRAASCITEGAAANVHLLCTALCITFLTVCPLCDAVSDVHYFVNLCITLMTVMIAGGEKARVALSIFVLVPHNLLILDEVSTVQHLCLFTCVHSICITRMATIT
jgi:hypothetical protein